MKTQYHTRDTVRVAFFVLLTVVLLSVNIPVSSASSLETQRITFTVDVPQIGFSVRSSIDVQWTDKIRIETGHQAALTYDLASAGSVLTVTVPLSAITFGIVDDQVISVPVPITPIGSVLIDLLKILEIYVPLVGLAGIASIDLVLESEIVVLNCGCTMGLVTIMTSIPTLQWQTWGPKEIQVESSNVTGSAELATIFGYAFSIGLRASVLGLDMWLISPVIISATAGSQVAVTSVEVVDPASMTLIYVGVGIAAVAVSILIFFVLRKWKREEV